MAGQGGRAAPRRFIRALTVTAIAVAVSSGVVVWLLNAGIFIPVIGSQTGIVVPYLGVFAWIVGTITLATAPTWWPIPQVAPDRLRFAWAMRVFLISAGTMLGLVWLRDRPWCQQVVGLLLAIPIVVLDVIANRLHWLFGGLVTGMVTLLTVATAGLNAFMLLVLLAFGVPSSATYADDDRSVIVEQVSNMSGTYERHWVRDGWIFRRA